MVTAIECNHLDIVIYLIENQYVDIHATYGFMERTALMLAASQGKSSIIEALLSRADTDLNAQDIEGNTALMLATRFCIDHQLSEADAAFINLFLEHDDCYISTRNNSGLIAFDIAMTSFYAPQSYQKYFLENPIFKAHQTLRLASGFFDFNAVLNTPINDKALFNHRLV